MCIDNDEEGTPWVEIDPPKKYRLVRADNMEPLGDWTENLQEGMLYLERRPDWLPKYVYIDESGRVVPGKVGVWDEQCGLVKMSWTEAVEYRKNNPDTEQDEEFEAAATAAETQHDPNICRFCGSGATDFGKNEPTVYCHDCKREYDENGDPINQDNGEEDD